MTIKVLFFGATADVTGKRQIEIPGADAAKASDLFAEIISKFPDLKHHKLLFAVNEQYADGDEILSDGDEVAIFTAVSGG